jgi:hypothetical protein
VATVGVGEFLARWRRQKMEEEKAAAQEEKRIAKEQHNRPATPDSEGEGGITSEEDVEEEGERVCGAPLHEAIRQGNLTTVQVGVCVCVSVCVLVCVCVCWCVCVCV